MDMSVWYRQRPSESLPTWLLRLWDMGVENVVLGIEMSRMASLTTHLPSGSSYKMPVMPQGIRHSWYG